MEAFEVKNIFTYFPVSASPRLNLGCSHCPAYLFCFAHHSELGWFMRSDNVLPFILPNCYIQDRGVQVSIDLNTKCYNRLSLQVDKVVIC